MPPKQPQQPTVRGTVSQCTCPFCGKIVGATTGEPSFKEEFDTGLLDRDAEFECDHCGNIMRITNIQTVTLVWVCQSPRNQQIKARRAQQKR